MKPVLGVRQLRIRPGVERLANPDSGQPGGGIWPTLTADNVLAWQVGDPDFIEINEKALVLSAGPNGNLLLTKQATFKSSTLMLTMAATKGTEAYLALRAHRGPDGWRAISLPVTDEGGKIRVSHPTLDFQAPDRGTKRQEFAPEKSLLVRFEIQRENIARVSIKQEKWKLACTNPPASEYTGAAGVFVKSGTLFIYALNVRE